MNSFLKSIALVASLLAFTGCNKEPSSPQSSASTTELPSEIPASSVVEHARKAADPWPAGNATAEGVACDLARAFLKADKELFIKSCMPETFEKNAEYKAFLDSTTKQIEHVKANPNEPHDGPVDMLRVFKARPLSKNGPGSFGYASHNFQNVMFVDIETKMEDGTDYTNRTLVFQLADKTWRAMPRPDLFPMLSTGLNDESKSVDEWTK